MQFCQGCVDPSRREVLRLRGNRMATTEAYTGSSSASGGTISRESPSRMSAAYSGTRLPITAVLPARRETLAEMGN